MKKRDSSTKYLKVQTSSACENHHRSVAEWPMLEQEMSLKKTNGVGLKKEEYITQG